MITVKHPKPNTVEFKEIRFGDTFISSSSYEGLYQRILDYDSSNAFDLATGLLAKFHDDDSVTLVDVVVEYSLRK